MIADHSQRLTSGRWEEAVHRALERVNGLSRGHKLAIALHDFLAVTAEHFSSAAPLLKAEVQIG